VDHHPAGALSLLDVSRGFSCLFWGLTLGLLLFTDALSIQVLQFLRFPSYLFGVAVAGWGLYLLSRSDMKGRRWRRHYRGMAYALALVAYMAPFTMWAERLPYVNYFFAHQMALLLIVLLMLIFANALVADIAQRLGDMTLRMEARGCNAVLALVLLLPALYAVVRTVHVATVRGSSYYMEWLQVGLRFPRFVFILLFFPVTLTLACLWKAGQICMHRIVELAGSPE